MALYFAKSLKICFNFAYDFRISSKKPAEYGAWDSNSKGHWLRCFYSTMSKHSDHLENIFRQNFKFPCKILNILYVHFYRMSVIFFNFNFRLSKENCQNFFLMFPGTTSSKISKSARDCCFQRGRMPGSNAEFDIGHILSLHPNLSVHWQVSEKFANSFFYPFYDSKLAHQEITRSFKKLRNYEHLEKPSRSVNRFSRNYCEHCFGII